jgi:hypothetical protein
VRFGEAKVTSHVQWQAEKMAHAGCGSGTIQRDLARRCAVQNVQRLIEIDGLEQVSAVLKDVMSVDVDLEQQWRLALTHGRRGQRKQQGCCVAVLEILVWFLVIPRHEQASVHATVHARGLCGPFVLPIVWVWGACSC